MFRPLVSVFLVALAAAPAAAQLGGSTSAGPQARTIPLVGTFQPTKSRAPAPLVKSPSRPTGVRSTYIAKSSSGLDPAWVAMMRARHELAKANGQLCPIREARQAARLAEAEASLVQKVKIGPPRKALGMRMGGVRNAGD